MARTEQLSRELLHELLDYDPITGLFKWRIKTNPRARIGSVAGCTKPDGYRLIGIRKKDYYGHRLAWFYVHGVWPADEIDHINGNKDDNRICNLREATHQQNNRNKAVKKNTFSGVPGVSIYRPTGQWRARIFIDGREKSLGYYRTKDEAIAVRAEAEKRIFGEFARGS